MIDKISDFFKNTKMDKKAWHDYRARVAALPSDYNYVMEQIQSYIFNVAMDAQSVTVLEAILELLEEGAAEKRAVLDVTGDDVAAFAYDVMVAIQAKTWTSQKGAQLNDRVHKHLGK